MTDIKPPSPSPASTISKQVFTISGILAAVYGLAELPKDVTNVACLWLLHPRLNDKEWMESVATRAIVAWNRRLQQGHTSTSPKGLIAVAFDQRNHGSREVDKLANEAWRSGNPRHAQDMFSIYHGTANDTSNLLTHLASYAFPHGEHQLTENLVLGVSLGGHAAWHCILHDPRITSAVVVIGCPDYTSLMTDRAAKSKLETWTSTAPPGSKFLGSKDFPPGLVEAIAAWDPAGLMMHSIVKDTQTPHSSEFDRFKALLRQYLASKRILNLSGGADKLVPYSAGEQFLQLFKRGVKDVEGISFEDVIFNDVGHEMTPAMAEVATEFICQSLVANSGNGSGVKESKM